MLPEYVITKCLHLFLGRDISHILKRLLYLLTREHLLTQLNFPEELWSLKMNLAHISFFM